MNTQRKISLMTATLGFLVFLIACESPTSGSGTSNQTGPAAQTNSNTITRAKYERIRVDPTGDTGMTIAEVRVIMGFDPTNTVRYQVLGNPYIRHTWFQTLSSTAYKIITVDFKNGRAYQKAASGL